MSRSTIRADVLVVKSLIRLAMLGMDVHDSVQVPAAIGKKWLSNHVTRLHSRGSRRYSVRTRGLALAVIRMADHPEELL